MVPFVDAELVPVTVTPLAIDTEDSIDFVLLSMELLSGEAPAPLQGLTMRLDGMIPDMEVASPGLPLLLEDG